MIRSNDQSGPLSRTVLHESRWSSVLAALVLTIVCLMDAGSVAAQDDGDVDESMDAQVGPQLPWDYLPYRVLIWLDSDRPNVNTAMLEAPLRTYLDLEFAALWRLDIRDAPVAIRAAARRNLNHLTYDSITSADPVIAVKRDHPEAVRIRNAASVGAHVNKVLGSRSRIAEVKRRAEQADRKSIDGAAERLTEVEGDELAVKALWAQEDTEALLVARGMAQTLTNPEAKLVTPTIDGLVGQAVDSYDKIFIVRIDQSQLPTVVSVVEMETLMQHFGPVATEHAQDAEGLVGAIGRAITRAFAPVVRIENAGQRSAVGLLRAAGLILSENSPGYVGVGDVLEPMTRKNDRNGKPIYIGRIEWAFLHVTESEDYRLTMDYYAGRPGGLQGRKNKRTFRTALKVRPFGEQTRIRLHAKGDTEFPLIGYEIYQRELTSREMTFVGRTDWNGRLDIARTDDTIRLLYVKNGGSVLARLPTVPGLTSMEVADISGDDLRLQAEAYIRGVQNAIIDLVAVRELFKARILMRLTKGTPDDMKRAEELFDVLRTKPTNARISDDMGKKQDMFIKLIGRNAQQRRKVDEMFTTTRELLAKHINQKMINDLELDVIAARKNGGKLPAKNQDQPE